MNMETIGVIGAGVMGSGLAQNLADTGHRVVLVDNATEALEKCRDTIAKNLRFQGFFNKAKKVANPDEVIARIKFTTDFDQLDEVQFLVENVVEKWPIKKEVWATIDPICPPDCVFAANTSAISITKLASATKRPEKVVGMHFMNPVPAKPTVEVIRGFHTTQETLDTALEFLGQFGKEGIIVNDMPGFVSNRVLMLTVNEAVFLVQDQVAEAEDVDKIFKGCFGHPMGPLETADLIGLDTILYSLDVLYESYNDPKFRPCPLLVKMVDAGLHGRKNGRGFYKY